MKEVERKDLPEVGGGEVDTTSPLTPIGPIGPYVPDPIIDPYTDPAYPGPTRNVEF